jgi:hypothetical protein
MTHMLTIGTSNLDTRAQPEKRGQRLIVAFNLLTSLDKS